MFDIRGLLKWSYGFERRHHILVGAAGIGGIDLYLANLNGTVHPILAFLAILSPFAALIALTKSPIDELTTLSVWALLALFGGGAIKLFVHPYIAPGMTLDQFTTSNPVGMVITVVTAVAMVTLIEAVMVFLGKKIYNRKTGGSGGSADTPEERVLTEGEYEDFEPIEYTKRILNRITSLSAECSLSNPDFASVIVLRHRQLQGTSGEFVSTRLKRSSISHRSKSRGDQELSR